MASILIIGGGICGLGTALLLARDGHDVTVLERDADPLPDSPQAAWEQLGAQGRRAVPPAAQLHARAAPDARDRAARRPGGAAARRRQQVRHGQSRCRRSSPINRRARSTTSSGPTPRGARPASGCSRTPRANEPRVTVRRGVQAPSCSTGAPARADVPHVVGVRTATGEDAARRRRGRRHGPALARSRVARAIGARPPYEEQADCGFTYYTRYFRGSEPQRIGPVFMLLGNDRDPHAPGRQRHVVGHAS